MIFMMSTMVRHVESANSFSPLAARHGMSQNNEKTINLTTSILIASGITGTTKNETKTTICTTARVNPVFRITLSEIFSMGTGIILSMAMKNKNPPQNAQTLSRPTMDEDGRSDSGLVGIACPATPAAVPAGPHVALRFSLPMLAACALAQDCRSEEDYADACTDARVLARVRDRRNPLGGFAILGQRPDESLVDFIRRYKRERRANG